MKISKGKVWSDPTAENCGNEINDGQNDAYFKISINLANKIAEIVTNGYSNRDIIRNLIANAIREQIRQYLREYDNVVAEDILNSLKGWKLGEVKGWMAEIDFEYARHGKLSGFGDELKKEFDRLKKENNLERIKQKIISLQPIPGTECDNMDGKVWMSNVLDIIDEEMKPKFVSPGVPVFEKDNSETPETKRPVFPKGEIESENEINFNDDLDNFDDMPDEEPTGKGDIQL